MFTSGDTYLLSRLQSGFCVVCSSGILEWGELYLLQCILCIVMSRSEIEANIKRLESVLLKIKSQYQNDRNRMTINSQSTLHCCKKKFRRVRYHVYVVAIETARWLRWWYLIRDDCYLPNLSLSGKMLSEFGRRFKQHTVYWHTVKHTTRDNAAVRV